MFFLFVCSLCIYVNNYFTSDLVMIKCHGKGRREGVAKEKIVDKCKYVS